VTGPPATIVFYISAHGLGHATREVAVINALAARRRNVRFLVRTMAPRWLIDASASAPVEVEAVETDPGVVQIDSLRLDEEETARRAAVFYGDFEDRASDEAAVLRRAEAGLVVGDIPPLAFAAAAHAGVRSVAIGNFTWDWIYSLYPAFDRVAAGVIDTIRGGYARARHALRLPLHGGFGSIGAIIEDIPFIARRSARGRAQARHLLGVGEGRPVVLASFGGYGLDLPYREIAEAGRLALLAGEAPRGLHYEDLIAAADVVVSKPGYGIVSDCLANETALLYTSRGRFAEYEVFVDQMPRILRCRYISQEDLLAGRWADAVDALVAQPPPPERPRADGAEVAAAWILNSLEGSFGC
jgi:voltage-gated potassium channel Kch